MKIKVKTSAVKPPKFARKDFDKEAFIRLASKVSKILREETEEKEREYGRFGVSL